MDLTGGSETVSAVNILSLSELCEQWGGGGVFLACGRLLGENGSWIVFPEKQNNRSSIQTTDESQRRGAGSGLRKDI